MRRRLKWIIGIAGAVVLFAELFARIVLGLGNPPLFEKSTYYGYRFKPDQRMIRFGNRIFFNDKGLRSENAAVIPRKDVTRILCIGDSITYGGALTDQKETYPYILEELLNKESSKHFEVLNASAPGWGIENEEAYMKKHGIYNSRIVVLQLNSRDLFEVKNDGRSVGVSPEYPVRKPLFALEEAFNRYLPKYFKGLDRPKERIKYSKSTEDILEENIISIVAIARIVESEGARLIVILVEQPREAELQTSVNKMAKQLLAEILGDLNVPYVNLGETFFEKGDRKLFYDNIHPNPEGNKVIAEYAAKMILSVKKE